MTDFNPIIIGTYNGQTVCRNMFNDRLFKYIFNNEKSKFITLNLINSLLMLEGENAYTDLTFCNSELNAGNDQKKSSLVDVLVRTQNGDKVNIEVQAYRQHQLIQRIMIYRNKIMQSILPKKGEPNELPNQTICIAILNETFFEDEYVTHRIRNIAEILKGTSNTGSNFNVDKGTVNENIILQDLNFNDGYIITFESSKFNEKLLKLRQISKNPRDYISKLSKSDRWLMYLSRKLSKIELEVLNMEQIFAAASEQENTFFRNQKDYDAYLVQEIEESFTFEDAIRQRDLIIADKDKKLAEKDKKLAEKDEKLAEKDKQLAEHDETIIRFAKYLKNEGKNTNEIINLTGLSKEKIDSL